jgi:hypothetical protein
MRSLLEVSANTQLDIRCLPGHSLLEDDYFATVPTIAVPPRWTPQDEDEEEVYTSFEEAISERAARISRYLSSQPQVAQRRPIDPAISSPISACLRHCRRAWRRAIILTCLALSLLLAGFDLMGLLVILR